jgi:AcrR family transcriptional regulator
MHGPAWIDYITDQSVINMIESETPPRRRRKQARPQELLDAALSLFVEKGFTATRAEEVAQRAGVSKGTLYLYYPSKEELLKAVIAHHLSARIAAGAALAADHSGPIAQLLRGALTAWWTELYDSPASGVFKLVVTEVRNFPEIAEFYVREVVEPAHRMLGQAIQIGIAQREFRDVNLDDTVHSLVLPLIMLCLHRDSIGACRTDTRLQPRRFIGAHVNLVLDALLMPQRSGEPTRQP